MMSSVVVELSTALICFMSQCYPVLLGSTTPTGTYRMTQYATDSPGYGGDILVFKFNNSDNSVYAIHRVINSPGQQRRKRIKSGNINDRLNITNGCINVSAEVYDLILDCCKNGELVIQ